MTRPLSLHVSEQVLSSYWRAAVKHITDPIEIQGGGPSARRGRVLAFLCGWEDPMAAKRMGGAAVSAELGINFAGLARLRHDQALGDQQPDFQEARHQLLGWIGQNWAEAWGDAPTRGHTPWDSALAPILAGVRRALTATKDVADKAMDTPSRQMLGRLVDLVDAELQHAAEHNPRVVAPLGQRRVPAPADLNALLIGIEKGQEQYVRTQSHLPDFSEADRAEGAQSGTAEDDPWSPAVNQWAALWAQANLGTLTNISTEEQNHVIGLTNAWMAAGYHEGLSQVPVIWNQVQSIQSGLCTKPAAQSTARIGRHW